MQIALIKSFTDKPWRSPETYERIEKELSARWKLSSIETKDPSELKLFWTACRTRTRCSSSISPST